MSSKKSNKEPQYRFESMPKSRFGQFYDLVEEDIREQEQSADKSRKTSTNAKSQPIIEKPQPPAPPASKTTTKAPPTIPPTQSKAKKTKSRGERAEEASAQLPINVMTSKISFPMSTGVSSQALKVDPAGKNAVGSASDWFDQLMAKMPSKPTGDSDDSTQAAPILLSERPDIWDAAEDSRQHKKRAQKVLAKLDPDQRKLDQKLAKIESEDLDKDDFLGNLMKNRTGDAFDDLIYSLPPTQKKKTLTKPSAVKSIKEPILDAPVKPAAKQKQAPQPIDNDSDEEQDFGAQKRQKVGSKGLVVKSTVKVIKKSTQSKEFTAETTQVAPIVEKSTAPKPPQGRPKPPGWTPDKGPYFSDVSKIGTSKTFDNFNKSCPDWYMEPAYQLDVRRMIDEFNKQKKYTGSPLSQWVVLGVNDPDTLRAKYEYEKYTAEQLALKEAAKVIEKDISKKESRELQKQSILLLKQPDLSHLSKNAKKQFEQLDMCDNDSDVDYVKVDYSDQDSDQAFETDDDDDDDEFGNVQVGDDSDEEFGPSTEDNQSRDDDDEMEGVCATPAIISHQILILPTQDHRLHALQEYYNNLTAKEASCRLKTRVVIVVRDGRVANQMICKIGLKITKHRKNNKGMSNAGLTVETKGIEMIHERLTDAQRAKALKKFAAGSATTMITTDEFLSMLWPHRNLIGCMIHYDIPLSEESLTGDKKKMGSTQNTTLTKAELEEKKINDDKFIALHTMSKMDERLSFIQRFETHFPDNYFNTIIENSFAKVNGKIVKQAAKKEKSPKPDMLPFKNTSLVFLASNTRGSRNYAKNMHQLYAEQYRAPKTAEALKKLAIEGK